MASPDPHPPRPAWIQDLSIRSGILLLPLLAGMAAVAAQGFWHDSYWGIGGHGRVSHIVSYDTVAWPLWLGSAILYGAATLFADRRARRRSWLQRIATFVSEVLGALLLLSAGLACLMGGA